MGKYRPKVFFLQIAAILIVLLTVGLWLLHVWLLWSYLIAINIVTFTFYGLDKKRAGTEKTRIPEQTLHLLALFGGTPAALIARALFHHKTKKLPFTALLLAILALQITLILCCWYFFLRQN